MRINRIPNVVPRCLILLACSYSLCSLAVLAADLKLNEPSVLAQCQPINITWTGGVPPFALNIGYPASPTFVAYLEYYPDIAERFFAWNVDIPAGTTIAFELSDNSKPVADIVSHALSISTGGAEDTSCALLSLSASSSSPVILSTTVATPTNRGVQPISSSPIATSEGGGAGRFARREPLSPYAIMGIVLGLVIAMLAAVAVLMRWVRARKVRQLSMEERPGEFSSNCRVNAIPNSLLSVRPRMLELDMESPPSSLRNATAMRQLSDPSSASPDMRDGDALNPRRTPFAEHRPIAARTGARTLHLHSGDTPQPSHQSTRHSDPFSSPHARKSQARPPPRPRHTAASAVPRQEVDGGIRLAGGPMEDEAQVDQRDREGDVSADDPEVASAIPPPYRRY